VTPEGILLQGTSSVVVWANPVSSQVWFDAKATPLNVQDLGSGVYHFPGTQACQAHDFTYEHLKQDESIELLAKSTFLIEPIAYAWVLEGQAISGSGTAKFTKSVQEALPPPNGTWLPPQEVQVDYDEGWPKYYYQKGGNQTARMVLTTRAADLDYPAYVELMATDASGRQFSFGNLVYVVGDLAQFGQDYYDYMSKCEIATLIVLSKIRTRPLKFVNDGRGIPVEQVVSVVKEAVTRGDPGAAAMLKAFTMSRGASALTGVFGGGIGEQTVGVRLGSTVGGVQAGTGLKSVRAATSEG
jgi:hypothetical protein